MSILEISPFATIKYQYDTVLYPHSENRLGDGLVSYNLKTLKHSMEEIGFSPDFPIRVAAGTLSIQDGHHRYVAAQTLKLDFWVQETYTTFEQFQHIKHGRDWSLIDHATKFANNGNVNYAMYLDAYYRLNVAQTSVINILQMKPADGAFSGSNSESFRKGHFIANDKYVEPICKILRALTDVRHKTSRPFVMALLKMLMVCGDISDKFIKDCSKNLLIEKKQPDMACYLLLFNKITSGKFKLDAVRSRP